jgi:hypothetical protein
MRFRIALGAWLAVAVCGCSLLVDLGALTGDGAQGAGGDGAGGNDGGDVLTGDGAVGGPDGSTADAFAVDGGPSARRYAAAVLADNPVLYLPLGEPAGSTGVKDATSKVKPTLIGTPQFGRPGAIAGDPDTAVAFGQNGIDCGPVFNFSGRQIFTIEMWARIPNDIVAGESRYLVRKGDVLADGGSPADAYSLFLSTPGVGFNTVFARRSAGLTRSTNPEIVPDTAFHHLVAIFTGTYLLLYRDGNVYGSDVDSNIAGDIAGSFYIALRDPSGGFARTEIDELAVYDVELPEARIKAHYDIGVGK